MKTAWTLEDLYRSIARGWLLLLIFTIAFSALALTAFQFWPQKFEATAVMTVEPLTVSAGEGSTSGVNMETERVVAKSSDVLVLASKSLGSPSISELSDATTVSVPKGSQVLEFTVTAEDPMSAAQWANAVANAYSERRVANAEAVVAEAITFLSGRIADLEQQLAQADPGSENVQTLEAQIMSLRNNQASLTSTTFYSGALISPAVAPSESTRPSLPIFIAGGLFVGLFLGSFGALLSGRRRLAAEEERNSADPDPTPARASRPVPPLHDPLVSERSKNAPRWTPQSLTLSDNSLEDGRDRAELVFTEPAPKRR